MSSFCNAYGAENTSGAVPFGGFLSNPVSVQHICRNRYTHRFVWVCECGHRSGEPVGLCDQHYREFTGDRSVPFNVRRDVRACPRCASIAEAPEKQHKCKVRLVSVS